MSSDVGHLWFLPALFVIFLLAELILSAAECIPGLRRVPDLFLGATAAALYLEGYRIGFGYPPLLNTFNNLIWFSVGYVLCTRQELVRRIFRHSAVKWGMICGAFLLLGYQLLIAPIGVLLTVGTKVLCIVSVYAVMPEKTCSAAEKIDRNSFGIYLFHSPLIYITFANIPNAHPAVVVFLNLVVFGGAAYGLTSLVRKTKLSLLIGE